MNRYLWVAAIASSLVACTKQTLPNDEPRPETPVEEPTAPASASVIQYHRDEDRGPRVYLPHDSPPCRADESANVTYQPRAVWRFDSDASSWVPLEFGSAENWKIGCNAMADLADIIGVDLEPGTYAIAAMVDGRLERGVIYEGPVTCNDVALGAAPDGQVALCIMGPSSANARFVPDPSSLQL